MEAACVRGRRAADSVFGVDAEEFAAGWLPCRFGFARSRVPSVRSSFALAGRRDCEGSVSHSIILASWSGVSGANSWMSGIRSVW